MQSFINFEGGLVRKGELRQINGANGNTDVINFTVARNYTKREGNDWVDAGTFFQECTAWGPIARSLANSDIPSGFLLQISGVLQVNHRTEYTDKNGVVHPEHDEETIRVDSVGVSLTRNQVVAASRMSKDGSTQSQQTQTQTQTPTQSTQSSAQTKASESIDDIFSDVSGSAESLDDIFAGL